MSEQMTTIQIPGADGRMLYGRRTRQEMISNYRAMAERKKFRLEKVLSAKDEDFIVMQHTGKCVKRNIVLLPHSSDAARRTNDSREAR